MYNEKIRILVVDDSSFMRFTISKMLTSDPDLEVIDTASNGIECVEKASKLKPDIITLDIEMPRMTGLEALKIIMRENPTPVIMLSSLTEDSAKETLEALSLGALDFIPKNLDDISINITRIKQALIEKIKAIGKKWHSLPPTEIKTISNQAIRRPLKSTKRKVDIVAIGSSTGGPNALSDIISALPSDFPVGGIIVQHMPTMFINPFAERLNQKSRITVKVAEPGDHIDKGVFLLAPGNNHLKLKKRKSSEVTVVIDAEPSDSLHRPSVDEMLLSVASVFSGKALAIILTGMGKDGLEGMKAIKKNNGKTIAQDEASCVVFGMPRAVIKASLADKILPLSNIAKEIINMV